MPYHIFRTGISRPQMMTLSKGGSVMVPWKSLTGPRNMWVTATQGKGLRAAHRAKKGYRLKMSRAQLAHHAMKGSGIFADIVKKAKHFLGRPATKKVIGQMVRSGAARLMRDTLGSSVEQYGSRLLDAQLSKRGFGLLGRRIVKRKKRVVKRRGKGLFSSIGNFFKKPSNLLGAASIPLRFVNPGAATAMGVASTGLKLAGHGVRRRRRLFKRKGGSFLLR